MNFLFSRIRSFLFQSENDGKFGTIKGVFIPDVLQMIGVILFMRLGFVLGHVGILKMSSIIILSALLLTVTGFSLTAIVTNMKMRGGGAYYLISRSLGIEFGSAIGILMCISQLCSIALCVSGFSLSLHEFLPDVPLWALKVGTLTTLVIISYISTDFALKTQFLIFICLFTSISSIFWGSGPIPNHLEPSTAEIVPFSFWMAFSMFFPAMTGIESGMSMSGDLRNPSRSLSIGTLAAIGVVFSIYLSIALFLSTRVAAEYLTSFPFILYYTSKVGFLIIIGIWSATLSSALGAILGGPRIMQAVAKDGILPKFLAKGYGPTNQPRFATIVVFILGMFLAVATNIDQIIPMLTMACLMSYSLINFIAFFEGFIKNPSWRPTFKTHPVISLIGSIGCFASMFMINAGATFIVLSFLLVLCLWVSNRKIQGNWDDLRHSIFSYFVHKGTVKLSNLEKSAKSWRPHILTIFNTPQVHKNLAYFSHAINQEKGFLTFGTSLPLQEDYKLFSKKIKEDLNGYKIPSHVHVNSCNQQLLGVDQMIRNYGFGHLLPNTVIFSILEKFQIDEFIQLILDTHGQEKNIVLLKDDEQKDYLYSDSTRKNKQINLWWRGKYPGNFELCLAFAYLLQQSKLWPQSKICIKMIAKDKNSQNQLEEMFKRYRTKLRIPNLYFTALLDPEVNFFSNIIEHSQDADLTFLGLKKPTPETSLEEYKDYYLRLLENTKDLKNVAYVLCGERVKFREIFL